MFNTVDYNKLDTLHGMVNLEKELAMVEKRFPSQHIVLLIDPLYKIFSGHICDEFDARRLFDNLDKIKAQHDLSIVMVHHSRQSLVSSDGKPVDMGADEAKGTSTLKDWCDTMVRVKLLNPQPKPGDETRIAVVLSRHAEATIPIFDIRWSRATLHPTIINTITSEQFEAMEEEDISIRHLL